MASEKLSALSSLAGGQVPTDLAYVVDVSAGTAGSKKSTLDDLFAEITKNITDGALRFAGFAAPAVSAASKGALYFSLADNTFKGSRNTGAYENLIFGSGGNTRVTVWSTGADQITGFAEFIYQPTGSGVGNKVVRLTVSGSGQDAQFYADNTFASTPSSAGLTNLGALNLTRLTTGSFPIITMNQGRSGPAFPQSLDVLGHLRWRSTNNTTFNEAAYIQTLASENHTSVAAGSGMEIWVTAPSATTATRRVMIGVGPVGQTTVFNADSANTVATNFGTNTRFAIRTPTTNDNNAIAIISGASSTTLKQLVLQAGVSQTANIFECQDSTGAIVYSISSAGVPSASGTITVGTTPISGGTTTRVLYDNAGVVGEYVITGTGNVVMSASPTLTGTVAMAAMTASGTITQTSASATAFESGPNGGTNPVFRIVNSTPSQADGLSVTGLAAGSGVTLTALSSGSNAPINITTKGTGAINLTAGSGGIVTSTGGSITLNTTGSLLVGTSGSYLVVNSVNLRVASGVYYGIASSSDNSTLSDVVLRRNGAANWALGFADAATATAQTLSVQNVVAGTSNTAGANWTRNASAGTGTGVGGAHIWQVAPAGSTGTTQNSFVEAMRIAGSGAIIFPSTVTSGGTTGDQTINKVSGTVNFAAAATTLTVTNSLVTTSSLVFCVVRTNDGTATIKNVVPGSGSFVITLAAAATAETSVGFFVINQ